MAGNKSADNWQGESLEMEWLRLSGLLSGSAGDVIFTLDSIADSLRSIHAGRRSSHAAGVINFQDCSDMFGKDGKACGCIRDKNPKCSPVHLGFLPCM